MNFEELEIAGSWLIRPNHQSDDRGRFTKIFSADFFLGRGLETGIRQLNISSAPRAGTLRGLHWQEEPSNEAKAICCLRGRVFDIIADVRPASPTFGRWLGIELDARDRPIAYIPDGCAHGYLTLEHDSEVLYSSTQSYDPARERVLRYDDPFFRIKLPMLPQVISVKDSSAPDFRP